MRRATAACLLLMLAACGSQSGMARLAPPPGDARWTRDEQLDDTWTLRSAGGVVLGVTFSHGKNADQVHVGFGTGSTASAGGRPMPKEFTLAIDLPGVAAGSRVGTSDEFLGWHAIELDRPVRANDPVAVHPGYSRSIHLDAASAFGSVRLPPGAYRFEVVLAGGGVDERIPVEFVASR